MSDNVKKPIKKWDMVVTYILGVVGQVLTIVMWFFPTLKAKYFSSVTTFVDVTEFDIALFSCSDQLPVVAKIFNLAFLLLSVLSLIWIALPLIKGAVMKPHNMIFPAIFNFIYLALFLIRYFNALTSFPLYDISRTAVAVIYFLGILFSLAVAITIVAYNPKLKKQLSQENTENS